MKRKCKSVSILALLCFFTLSASIFAQNGTKKFNSAKLQSGGDLLVTVVGADHFTGDGYYSDGDIATVEVINFNCTWFSHWADADGNVISEENPITFTVTGDTTLYAVMEDAPATLVVQGANIGGYIATDTLICIWDEDDTPKVEAVAFEGYVFSHWSGVNGDTVSTDNPYYVNTADFAESRIELGANFTKLRDIAENLISKLNVSPNPTAADFTISFELINANNMHIVLTDLIGRDIAEVYNGFTNAGIFTKTFSIGTLPTGVYYLKISQNGKNIGTEKIIKK